MYKMYAARWDYTIFAAFVDFLLVHWLQRYSGKQGTAAISCPWWVTGGDAAIAHGQQRLQPITDMAAYSALRC